MLQIHYKLLSAPVAVATLYGAFEAAQAKRLRTRELAQIVENEDIEFPEDVRIINYISSPFDIRSKMYKDGNLLTSVPKLDFFPAQSVLPP